MKPPQAKTYGSVVKAIDTPLQAFRMEARLQIDKQIATSYDHTIPLLLRQKQAIQATAALRKLFCNPCVYPHSTPPHLLPRETVRPIDARKSRHLSPNSTQQGERCAVNTTHTVPRISHVGKQGMHPQSISTPTTRRSKSQRPSLRVRSTNIRNKAQVGRHVD
ncbi:hypothetical protein HBI04_136220 [Parastagonospora nodorum]|nr:hypothetical protein HBH42_109400 [Parastagonospora nodorum]KAH4267445.1 hypothetical protein HBI03_066400 [Parastagonospora nodorum]KAH4273294.1 hypothetical protein HBI04_136220 [Parastagonospora nodorum]KAH4333081.1 hypothetical protein HBI00_050100 [Parastagonospora nodorum]KAH4376825.1 hypothetical protein HBH97_114060 [Parastagonospora nodorum]